MIDAATRRLVRERAGHRCEYCGMPQAQQSFPFFAVVVLFHPRRDVWETHFALRDALMVGLTPTGRTTVRVLHMNAADRVQLRKELQEEPPSQPH